MLFGSFQQKTASFEKIVEALEKMATIPCNNEDINTTFIAKGSSIETQVEASSGFEAAVKMGHVLYDLKLLKPSTLVEVTDNKEDKYFYDVSEGSKPSCRITVQLNRVLLKNFPVDGIQNANPAQTPDRDVENRSTNTTPTADTTDTTMDGEGDEETNELVTTSTGYYFIYYEWSKRFDHHWLLSSKPPLVLCSIKSLIDISSPSVF